MTKENKLDYSKIEDVELEGIDYSDAPEFCDVYIYSALYDGKPMTTEQLDLLNEDHDFVAKKLEEYLY